MEMAPLKTGDYFLYECVKLSTYCIFRSLKSPPAAQTTFTNNRCSNKYQRLETEIDHVRFYIFLPLFSSVSETEASPGPGNGNRGVSPQSKENIIQRVPL